MIRHNPDGVVRTPFGQCAHVQCAAALQCGEWHAPECPHHLPDADPPPTVRVLRMRPTASGQWVLS